MMAALRDVVFGTALGNSSTRRARLTADIPNKPASNRPLPSQWTVPDLTTVARGFLKLSFFGQKCRVYSAQLIDQSVFN